MRQIAAPYHPECKPRLTPATGSPNEARKYFMKEFPDLLVTKDDFHNGTLLRMMGGPAMRIYLKDDVKPYAVCTPRLIPLAWQGAVKQELEAMVSLKQTQRAWRGLLRPPSAPAVGLVASSDKPRMPLPRL